MYTESQNKPFEPGRPGAFPAGFKNYLKWLFYQLLRLVKLCLQLFFVKLHDLIVFKLIENDFLEFGSSFSLLLALKSRHPIVREVNGTPRYDSA